MADIEGLIRQSNPGEPLSRKMSGLLMGASVKEKGTEGGRAIAAQRIGSVDTGVIQNYSFKQAYQI